MFCGLTHNLTDHIYLPCICTYIKYRNALLKLLLTPVSDWNSSQISSEACYSCCSNKPRTHQWGHLHRPPLRPPAICGLVWAAVLLAPLALWWAAPPVLFNYLHDGVSPPPSRVAVSGASRTHEAGHSHWYCDDSTSFRSSLHLFFTGCFRTRYMGRAWVTTGTSGACNTPPVAVATSKLEEES